MKVNNIITIEEANHRSSKNWTLNNDCDFHGIVDGYVCGFCVEAIKDGKIGYGSCCFTNDIEEILDPEYNNYWNDLGISANLLELNGWTITGDIAFRGYYTEEYDFNEREEYYLDASKEVEELFNTYVI